MKQAIRSTVLCGLFAALIGASACLAIPTPAGVPLTLQTFVIAWIGFLCPPSLACKAVAVYLLCGAVGLPVFGSMQGGISLFFGPTGGYLWSFPLLALGCSLSFRLRLLRVFSSCGGLMLCHFFGALQTSLVTNAPLGLLIVGVALPLLAKDLILTAAAWALSLPCKRALKHSRLLPSPKKE